MGDILRITVTGQNQPGLTLSITSILADYGVETLDIGQSVLHATQTLNIIFRLSGQAPDGEDTAVIAKSMFKDLHFHCHAHDLTFSYQPVSEKEYETWKTEQGKHRYILTLLSRHLTLQQITGVSGIIAAHGLTIDHISRLSGSPTLNHHKNDNCRTSCLEFSVHGTPSDPEQLRLDFLALSADLDADIAFQEDSIYRRNRRLVVFDMDSTLIEEEVIDLLAEAAGVGCQVAAITERAMHGELDFNESFRARLAMLKGLDELVLNDIARQLTLTEGAESLITTLSALGYRTAILSGGFTFFAQYLQEKLGIDYIHANELETVDGKVTGEVRGDIVNGEEKAQRLKQIAAEQGISIHQVVAVGDGANDLPMLSIAGLGIAFRAKPVVKQRAPQSISTLGLDSILYLLGFSGRDLASLP